MKYIRDGYTFDDVARVCHEANAAWCLANGYAQPKWEDAEEWMKDSYKEGVQFHLSNPDADASLSHENWRTYKLKGGWVFGDIADAEKKTHPCMVPFAELPPFQQIKDSIFKNIVHAFMEAEK